MAEETKTTPLKKILLVDDDPDLLLLLSKTIESWGYEVIAVPSGKDAIGRAASDKPDIVIMDYMMPGMDGITALREIRKTDTKILAILFTVDLDSVPIKDTTDIDISTFIPKWYPETMLKTAIEMAVKKIDDVE